MIETRATHEIVEAFLASRRALQRKPTTIKGYAWALHKLSARFPDALPSEDDLVNFFAEEEALQSFKAFFWRLRTFFEWVARHDLGANAMDGLEIRFDRVTRKWRLRRKDEGDD